MLTVELPWPSNILSQNARGHWAIKERARKAAIETAYWLTKAELQKIGHPRFLGFVSVFYTFCPPRNYRYDDDNLTGKMKYPRDGIAKALGIDDYMFRQQAVEFGAKVAGGKVVVVLKPAVLREGGLGIDGGDA